MKLIAVILITLLAFNSGNSVCAQSWEVKSVTVNFRIKNAGLAVKGSFSGFKGVVVFNPAAPASGELKGTVEVSSIETGITMRNNHLKKAEYFDAEKFPVISMVSKKITKNDKGYSGQFDLKIKGVTKQVTIPLSFTEQGKSAELTSSFEVNRLDFGVGSKGMVMSSTAKVEIMATLEKK
jgi:polyisoprenoid-binding protein YceI